MMIIVWPTCHSTSSKSIQSQITDSKISIKNCYMPIASGFCALIGKSVKDSGEAVSVLEEGRGGADWRKAREEAD